MEEKTVDVAHVAKLARLSLTEEQTARMSAELSDFARFARVLSDIPTEELDNTAPAALCRMRSDNPLAPSLSATDLVGEDRVHDGYVCVPPTIEEE